MCDVLPTYTGYPRKFDLLVVDEMHNIAPAAETRMTYTPSDAFETLLFPAALCREMQTGLTDAYNRFHADTRRDPDIKGMRALQREMDTAAAHAYGWGDIDLGHELYEVPYLPDKDRVRFTISEPARIDALRRMPELNHQRYEDEVAQGLYVYSMMQASSRTS